MDLTPSPLFHRRRGRRLEALGHRWAVVRSIDDALVELEAAA
jgi:hypothetical protein